MGERLLVISYLSLRKAIGLIGVGLPFVLAIGLFVLHGQGLQSSVSSYYHTDMRDVFVGALCAVGVFLLSYRGYEPKDDIAGNLACAFAIGTALFPTTPDASPTQLDAAIGVAHAFFAASFLITLAYFSLALFTKMDPKRPPSVQKLMRNRIYFACGYAILGAVVLIGALVLIDVLEIVSLDIEDRVKEFKPVWWLESIAIVAFGISWMTKGEAMLKD